MAYRAIDLRIWGDERVRKLSRPPPNGRDCWLYLLTARESIVIPGVIPAGAAAMAETLRWEVEGFRAAFAEVEREGLAKADWDAPLVWVPKALKYNPPHTPNVVLAWARAWDDVPECELKAQILQALSELVAGFGEGFRKAFAESFGAYGAHIAPISAGGAPQPSRKQYQYQYQYQKEDLRTPGEDPESCAQPDLLLSEAAGAPSAATAPGREKPKKEPKQSRQQKAYAWMVTERAAVTDRTERAPKHAALNAMIGPVLDELGNVLFKATYRAYLADQRYASKSPPWPLAVFLAVWRQHVPASPQSSATKPLARVEAGDDPYRQAK